VDFGKTVVTHDKYLELLGKAGQSLKMLPHRVINEKEEKVEICSSVECKGIIGNDGRHYILDLLRTFPPDVNFLLIDPSQESEGVEYSKEATELVFPRSHRHKLCCLRQELVDAFFEARYMMFIKLAAHHLQQLGQQKKEQANNNNNSVALSSSNDDGSKTQPHVNGDSEKEPAKTSSQPLEKNTKEVVKKAAQVVGSLKEFEFDIRFNPDVYSEGVKHAESADELKKQRLLVHEAADFVLSVQIPTFVRDCLDNTLSPMDGITLSEGLHSRGINIRYLGVVANLVSKSGKQLEYLHSIVVTELITRAAKHIFTSYIQGLEMTVNAVAISHFLNCFLSSCHTISLPSSTPDGLFICNPSAHKNRRSRKTTGSKNGKQQLSSQESSEWTLLTPRTLWQNIRTELDAYYHWNLGTDNVDDAVNKYSLQKISLLRSICFKTGIQISLREYSMDQRNKPAFSEEDIINIFPVVKHIHPRASDAYNFYQTGQTKIQQGFLKEGYELISESLNLLNNVYGAIHPEIAQCLRMLARLNYIMGDYQEATAFQQKAVLMSEKVNGIDHPYTVTEYTHLALYCFASSQITIALKLLYRARYLLVTVSGEIHPEMAVLDSNIGLILHAVGEYDLSLKFLSNALTLNIRYFGPKSLKVAVSYHLVARTQSCQGDFRSALQNEKETFAIYRYALGEEHEKTKESSDCLKHLTQQAVVLQRKMNQICKGNASAVIPPIQIQSPSMSAVLEMLNIINGILFVQISTGSGDDVSSEERPSKEKSLEENDRIANASIA